jgi:carboxyl-terminal processing protease
VPAGPADKQGELQPSDRIVAVAQGDDGEFEDVIGWRLDEVVELIRGPKGSTVRLQVLPAKAGTDAERKTISIVRNEVKLEEQSAQKRIIEPPRGDGDTVKVGVIDIPTFYIDFEAMRRGDDDYKSTTRDVRRLLEELRRRESTASLSTCATTAAARCRKPTNSRACSSSTAPRCRSATPRAAYGATASACAAPTTTAR